MKKFLIILFYIKLLLISSCGYEIINKVYNYKFEIVDTQFEGDVTVNKKLEKYFLKFQNKNDATRFFKIKSNSKLIKKVTSRNSAGEESSYSIRIIVVVDIIENNQIVNKSNFEKNVSYNALNSKFELRQYEKDLINDLVEQIMLDISTYLGTL
mgnify:CR=1 FL=1|tara:strand:+ start:211 stop:672 length:462 start_codon:yes stop_codon:yes gene_type:complete